MTRTHIVLIRLVLLALVLGAWEVLPRSGAINPLLLPPLSQVLGTLGGLLGRPDVQEAIGITAGEVLVAFLIAVPLGATLGIVIAENEYVGQIFKPMLFYVFSVPKSIFLPLFILVFGIGFPQKVAYAAFTTTFVVLMSAMAAVSWCAPTTSWWPAPTAPRPSRSSCASTCRACCRCCSRRCASP